MIDGLVLEITCGACPLQIEGSIDGVPFYFRARGSQWRMGVGGDTLMDPDWYMSDAWGGGPFAAGHMPEGIGLAIVEMCCLLWRIRARSTQGERQ